MAEPSVRYRFGVFELDTATGELRRKGLRVRLHAQPCQVLALLLARPGQMVTRDEISRVLWPDGTFVDFDHGVNSAMNRLRDALGDKARSPRFVETIARRGYRFIAPVEPVAPEPVASVPVASVPDASVPVAPDSPVAEKVAEQVAGSPAGELPPEQATLLRPGRLSRLLAAPTDLPETSPVLVGTLFVLLQCMYLGFYVGALANLPEVADLLSVLPYSSSAQLVLIATAALLIPARLFLVCAVLFRAPGFAGRFLRLWPVLLVLDILWSLAPFLLLHHLSFGLALGGMTMLVYSPFAQRSLVLMGAGRKEA